MGKRGKKNDSRASVTCFLARCLSGIIAPLKSPCALFVQTNKICISLALRVFFLVLFRFPSPLSPPLPSLDGLPLFSLLLLLPLFPTAFPFLLLESSPKKPEVRFFCCPAVKPVCAGMSGGRTGLGVHHQDRWPIRHERSAFCPALLGSGEAAGGWEKRANNKEQQQHGAAEAAVLRRSSPSDCPLTEFEQDLHLLD